MNQKQYLKRKLNKPVFYLIAFYLENDEKTEVDLDGGKETFISERSKIEEQTL